MTYARRWQFNRSIAVNNTMICPGAHETSIRPAKHRSYAWGAMLACMAGLARSQQPAPYELVDLATPYTTFWDETRNLPTAERVAAFKKRFDELLPGFFSIERASWTTSEKYDRALVRAVSGDPGPLHRHDRRFLQTTGAGVRK